MNISCKIFFLAISASLCFGQCSVVWAGKPTKPDSGGSTAAYTVIPLSGMIAAYSVSEPNGNIVKVLGDFDEAGYTSAIVAQVNVSTQAVTYIQLPEPTDGKEFDLASNAVSQNASGVIVGFASVYDVDPDLRVSVPARWVPRTDGYSYEGLPVIGNDPWGFVSGINDLGLMVGSTGTGLSGGNHAVLWTNDGSQAVDLNSQLPNDSPWVLESAHDINNSGLVVGDGWLGGIRRSYVFDLGTNQISAVPLPSGALESQGCFEINELGEIVGSASSTSVQNDGWGFFSDGLQTQYLPISRAGTPFASGLNNLAELVGVQTENSTNYMALWKPGSNGFVVTEMDTQIPSKPTWALEYGFGINDAGMICGKGRKVEKGRSTWSGVLVVPKQ